MFRRRCLYNRMLSKFSCREGNYRTNAGTLSKVSTAKLFKYACYVLFVEGLASCLLHRYQSCIMCVSIQLAPRCRHHKPKGSIHPSYFLLLTLHHCVHNVLKTCRYFNVVTFYLFKASFQRQKCHHHSADVIS